MSAMRALLKAALELDGASNGMLSQVVALVKRYRAKELTAEQFAECVCDLIEGKKS